MSQSTRMFAAIVILQTALAGAVMAQGTPQSSPSLPNAQSSAALQSVAQQSVSSPTSTFASSRPSIASAASQATIQAPSREASGPRADMARAGINTQANAPAHLNADATSAAPQHLGEGQNIALMVVGGAALISGLVIGGDGGTLIAIGGAVVGLYGLFNFVK